MALGFIESKADSNPYFKVEGGRPVIILLYVDDLFLTKKQELIKVTRRRHVTEFEMKDFVMIRYFLGMKVWETVDGISLGNPKQVRDDGKKGHDHTYGIEPKAIE